MRKIVASTNDVDMETAKIAEMFHQLMTYVKNNKGKKLSYMLVCTSTQPDDITDAIQESGDDDLHLPLEGFCCKQGFASMISLMIASELSTEDIKFISRYKNIMNEATIVDVTEKTLN
jgi:hypothetical protein